MDRVISIIFTDCLYSREYNHVYAVDYYLKYKKLYIIYENGKSELVANVDEFKTGSDVSCNVITD